MRKYLILSQCHYNECHPETCPHEDDSYVVVQYPEEKGVYFGTKSSCEAELAKLLGFGKDKKAESNKLISINFNHYCLSRAELGDKYSPYTAIISNFRQYIVSLGFDCSLLNDSEVMALEEEIYAAEQSEDGEEAFKELLKNLT